MSLWPSCGPSASVPTCGASSQELRHPAPTLQDTPPFMRAAVRSAFTQTLSEVRAATAAGPKASQPGPPPPGIAELGDDVWRSDKPRALSAGRFHPGVATYPELRRGGAQRLCVLAAEVGGRWNADAPELVRQLVRVRALRAPPALRAVASSAWARRWWGMLSIAVQHAVVVVRPQRYNPAAGPRPRPRACGAGGPSRLPLR
eukprot:s352_g12.t1